MIIIQLTYLFICIIEAKLEQYVIAQKRTAVPQNIDDGEHAWSAVYSITVGISLAALCAWFAKDWMLLLSIIPMPFIRRGGFDFSLKIFRKRKLFLIEGFGLVDRFSRWLFTRKGGWLELAACIALVASLNYLFTRI